MTRFHILLRFVSLALLSPLVIAPAVSAAADGEVPTATADTASPAAAADDLATKDLADENLESWQRQLKDDLAYLASDELRGRSATEPSSDVAAEYVVKRFGEAGLQTNLFSDSPLQPVAIHVGAQAQSDGQNHVVLRPTHASDDADADAGIQLDATLGESMNPMAIGIQQASVQGRLVFAGYGITAPEFDYDDYADVDATGAVVIVLRKEPGSNDAESRFEGTQTTTHAYFTNKIRNAIEHGAVGLILVNDRHSISDSLKKLTDATARERQRASKIETELAELPAEATNSRDALERILPSIQSTIEGYEQDRERASRGLLGISEAGDRTDASATIPVVSVSRDLLDQLLVHQKQQTLEDIERQIDSQQIPASFVIDGYTAELAVALKSAERTSHNVLGVIPGRGPLAEETVIIGAHYDHVGMGGFGSLAPGTIAVHNGADDNASGAVTIMACAGLLQERLKAFDTHRRVLFIAFTGEERGLLGSAEYVRRPRFPLDTTAAMLNLDMVGRLRDNELTVYGTGTGDTLDGVLEQANFKHQFQLFKVPSGYGPSDHQSFYEAGVPVLFFFTGLHNDYHRPSDDFDKIDFGGLFRITDMVCDVASQLAIQTSRPTLVQTDKGAPIRRQLTAFLGVTLSSRGDHVVLSDVSEGSPAMLGGLKTGDRLERLGKTRIRTATDVLDLLRERSPGDQLEVEVTRQGQRIDAQVRLQSRPQ